MKSLCAMLLILVLPAPPLSWGVEATAGTKDQEIFNQGKIAIFDKNWEGARVTFQRVINEFPQSSLVPQAYYFIARCYQFQGKDKEALQAYDRFLRKYPDEPFLPIEARNAMVELSASIMEKGDPTYRSHLISSLSDPRKEVRYFAAIRCSRLKDSQIAAMTVPVLRDIVRTESDGELADRARIALLRLDPKGLSAQAEAPLKAKAGKAEKRQKAGEGRMFHLVVYKAGSAQPAVELNLPVSLAQLAIAALDESSKAELRKKGVDVENVWESLKTVGPANILTIRDGENMIRLWIQ
jgi:tetratricopeptide (TPR) repeat protein